MFIFVLFYAMSSLVFIHLLVDIIEVRTSMNPRCSCGLGSFVSWNHKLKLFCGCQCVHQQLWDLQASFISCWERGPMWVPELGFEFCSAMGHVCLRKVLLHVCLGVGVATVSGTSVRSLSHRFMEIVFSASLVQGLVVRARYN